MKFSRRYSESLTWAFRSIGEVSISSKLVSTCSLSRHNVFNKLLVVDVSSDEIEIPVIAKAVTENVVTNKLLLKENTEKVVISLYPNSSTIFKNTADSIVTTLFGNVNFSQRLQKVTTNKGETYYGNRGIILDKDLEPLILCSLICKINRSEQYIDYFVPVIHVNPKIFLGESGLIGKSILKKIIPFYLTYNTDFVAVYNDKFRNKIPSDTKPQILIDDMSRFIESPIPPNPKTCSNEALNKLLINNIQDVIEQM